MTKEELLSSEFLKQFKDSKDFGNFMDSLYKRGVESMLQGEIESHLGYSKNQKKPIRIMQEMVMVKRRSRLSMGSLILMFPEIGNQNLNHK